MTIFEHRFLTRITTFAEVSWFDGIHTDTESNLIYVLANAQTQSIVPIKALSKPLVVGCDDENVDKLWILNLK